MRGRRSELVGFRFPQELRRRWRTYLALVVLLGLVGGVALGSIAAARTTQSSFPAFLKTTNPSDLDIDNGPYDPALLRRVAKLPGVTSVQTYVSLNVAPVHPDGTPDMNNPFGDAEAVGTLSKLYISQDKITIIDGRMLDPRRPDEIVVSKFFADLAHLHVGQREPVGVFSNAQISNEGVPSSPAAQRLTFTIVGIGVFNDEVVQTTSTRSRSDVVSPVLARRVVGCCVTYAWSGVQLAGGAAAVQPVLREYVSRRSCVAALHPHTSTIEAKPSGRSSPVDRPRVFRSDRRGGRPVDRCAGDRPRIDRRARDRTCLRPSARPGDTAADSLLGVVLALVVGSWSPGVAVALSPLEPFGPVRIVPAAGPRFRLDRGGARAGAASRCCYGGPVCIGDPPPPGPTRRAPSTSARAGDDRPGRVGSAHARGRRYALRIRPGPGPATSRALCHRRSLFAVMARRRSSSPTASTPSSTHPALYGWNWNYGLKPTRGYGAIPPPRRPMLPRAVRGRAWGVYRALHVQRRRGPGAGRQVRRRPRPPQFSGHGLDGRSRWSSGARHDGDLHKKIGDTVVARYTNHVTRLHIVGTATMPTVGVGHGLHLSLGTGAGDRLQVIPAIERNIQGEGRGPEHDLRPLPPRREPDGRPGGPPAGGRGGEPGLRIGGQRPI